MSRKANWYDLDMLLLYLSISEEQLQASLEQLQNLKGCVGKSYVLNNEMVNQIIKIHEEQNEITWVVIEQCQKWQQQNPSKKQLGDIKQLEKNTYDLENINKQVLDLARSFKQETIDSIFQKDDLDLALVLFFGKHRY